MVSESNDIMMALETAFPEYNPLLPPPSGVQARRVPGLLQLERRVQNQTQARISNANPNSYPYANADVGFLCLVLVAH